MNEVFVPFPVSRVLAVLRAAEWAGGTYGGEICCPSCHALKDSTYTHEPDCELAAIKADLERQVQS